MEAALADFIFKPMHTHNLSWVMETNKYDSLVSNQHAVQYWLISLSALFYSHH